MTARKIAKKLPAKKAAARTQSKGDTESSKPVSKKAAPAKKVVRKAGTRKATAKKIVQNTRRKPVAKQADTTENYGTVNPHGFQIGSDVAIVVDTMIDGGFDRRAVLHNAMEALPTMVTRNGGEKNISALCTKLLKSLQEDGYTVESHWRLVPPARIQKLL